MFFYRKFEYKRTQPGDGFSSRFYSSTTDEYIKNILLLCDSLRDHCDQWKPGKNTKRGFRVTRANIARESPRSVVVGPFRVAGN